MTAENKPGLLQGVKIVDLTSVVFGPLATQMLGDLGADVIKVEGPEGDLLRQVQPSRNKLMGAAFLGANRNKRSVVLDLKTQTGRDQLRKLLIDADVMISSIRPAALARLSLAPETLRQENPQPNHSIRHWFRAGRALCRQARFRRLRPVGVGIGQPGDFARS